MTTAAPGRIDEPAAPPRRRVAAWALWDWGSAAFNAVVTTFVFSTYLASSLFVDPAIVAAAGDDARNPALLAAKADTSGVISLALTIAGLLIAVLAPVLGQRSDGSGRRRLWLGINTGIVVLAMLGMVFVEPVPSYLWVGAVLLATGNVFFEFASVNYNAMLVQVSTPRTVGRVSGLGWGMGYVGGIVLLALLLGLFLFDFGTPGASGLLGLPSGEAGGALDVRIAILVAAIWCAVFSIPVLVGVPEIPATPGRKRQGIVDSYRTLFRRIAELYRESPRVLVFLLASAVFRDGLAAVFTFGAIIAAQVFGFTTTEVLLFGVAANVVAGIGTFAAGWFDDRFGAKPVILVSLVCLILGGSAVLGVGDAKAGFWATGLFLCLFVGPVQSSSRTFLARISPAGREGEMFGLYTTTGRAVSFLAPGLFGIAVAITGDTRFGIIGIVIVLLAGLLLMLRVRGADARVA
ncbi:MFS transporter [Clavibacter michiganensis]|uniref:MFS transporter n=1 Tax=Clavibacter michiganensis TaxID=28447 RepID=UPI000A3A87C7|nr:MFS transporter [Clavibacter michiganensis]MBE3079358.1 MFS transporter [Clavibacter michiganensis subsp. michiganensis]MDO4100663.1 MFS transporter [Clavibacter michiganensis]MDO4128089.1 MFS transporter [Clavibacter michiganensis]MWJ17192.1 MFS transporter [Clavibacter michiganensis subsp. michiganensis]NIY58995.1 MFS transporter [Clavibacter michiganensis subsp. michiganensis]